MVKKEIECNRWNHKFGQWERISILEEDLKNDKIRLAYDTLYKEINSLLSENLCSHNSSFEEFSDMEVKNLMSLIAKTAKSEYELDFED